MIPPKSMLKIQELPVSGPPLGLCYTLSRGLSWGRLRGPAHPPPPPQTPPLDPALDGVVVVSETPLFQGHLLSNKFLSHLPPCKQKVD